MMRRLTRVARSITREKRLRQLLDPAPFEPAPLHLDAVLERINGTHHSVGSSIRMKCELQSRIRQ